MQLPDDWGACERGNDLYTSDDRFVAWLTVADDLRLEISYVPDNYPSLNVQFCRITDGQLATHINNRLQGWTARKTNCPGVNIEGTRVRTRDD